MVGPCQPLPRLRVGMLMKMPMRMTMRMPTRKGKGNGEGNGKGQPDSIFEPLRKKIIIITIVIIIKIGI